MTFALATSTAAATRRDGCSKVASIPRGVCALVRPPIEDGALFQKL